MNRRWRLWVDGISGTTMYVDSCRSRHGGFITETSVLGLGPPPKPRSYLIFSCNVFLTLFHHVSRTDSLALKGTMAGCDLAKRTFVGSGFFVSGFKLLFQGLAFRKTMRSYTYQHCGLFLYGVCSSIRGCFLPLIFPQLNEHATVHIHWRA